jgi:hypothetical protein
MERLHFLVLAHLVGLLVDLLDLQVLALVDLLLDLLHRVLLDLLHLSVEILGLRGV